MEPVKGNENVKKLRKRVIKSFLDLFVLAEDQERPLSGYDIVGLLRKRFDVYFSPGSVYSLLFSLERNCLVAGKMFSRKRVYALTEKGEETLRTVASANGKILGLLRDMLGSATS
ncbi:MAG: PadR family transcriptional regulator [Candidatus Bathyarchaeum sp.]|nr:MAG: PadR family transcriptional regulator [Candidatus Bathyarchaeum sp.]